MRTRTLLGTAFAVVALSMPIAGITAGIADARPNTNGLAAECRASNGGTWVVDSSGGRVTGYRRKWIRGLLRPLRKLQWHWVGRTAGRAATRAFCVLGLYRRRVASNARTRPGGPCHPNRL
jgi:hypothetical protein